MTKQELKKAVENLNFNVKDKKVLILGAGGVVPSIIFALKKKPDIIWFYNVQLIKLKTIIRLKKLLPSTILTQYANDNPFSSKARKGLWNNFLKSIHLFDIHFAYRLKNLLDFKKYGAKSTYLLRSY